MESIRQAEERRDYQKSKRCTMHARNLCNHFDTREATQGVPESLYSRDQQRVVELEREIRRREKAVRREQESV